MTEGNFCKICKSGFCFGKGGKGSVPFTQRKNLITKGGPNGG